MNTKSANKASTKTELRAGSELRSSAGLGRCAWKDDDGNRCKADATCEVDVFGDSSCHGRNVWVEVGFCDEHTESMNG